MPTNLPHLQLLTPQQDLSETLSGWDKLHRTISQKQKTRHEQQFKANEGAHLFRNAKL